MKSINIIKDNLIQISSVVEKEMKLYIRFKLPLILSFINPIISLILPLAIMGQIFNLKENLGFWNSTNFVIYILTTYMLGIIFDIRNRFPVQFGREKVWKTLPALVIAPFNRLNLLLGTFFSHMIISSIPFIIFFTLAIIILPISIITILSMLIIYFFIALIFSGLGLVLGVLAISKPSISPIARLGLTILFIFSCISYPFEFFPEYFQGIVILNPLYYIIDLVRIIWIDNNIILSICTHPFHVLILIVGAILSPLIGLKIFDFIFEKYGIVGY